MKKIVAEIQQRTEELLREKGRILISIDGSCTSGKSTLAAALTEVLDCNLIHMDDFFLRPEQRTSKRFSEVGGNVDYERFLEEVLLPLKNGESFAYRPYDCGSGILGEPVQVQPKRINIIEGSYSNHPYFEDPYDLKVFLKISPEIRKQRVLQRPVFLQKRFFEEWIPMEEAYFSGFSIAQKSDLICWPEENQ